MENSSRLAPVFAPPHFRYIETQDLVKRTKAPTVYKGSDGIYVLVYEESPNAIAFKNLYPARTPLEALSRATDELPTSSILLPPS